MVVLVVVVDAELVGLAALPSNASAWPAVSLGEAAGTVLRGGRLTHERSGSEVGVDFEERVDAFKQSRFDFVRRAVNDV